MEKSEGQGQKFFDSSQAAIEKKKCENTKFTLHKILIFNN